MNYGNINIKADEKTLGKLFERRAVYEVPQYQRRFAWGTEQFEDLWNDIQQGLKHERVHSLGEIKLVPHRDDDPPTLEIIDGQQRLTTLALLICALRDDYKRRNANDKFIEQLQALLQTQDRDANKLRQLRLLDVRGDDEEYQAIYDPAKSAETDGAVCAGYRFFSDKVRQLSDGRMDQIRTYIMDGLSFIRTEVDDRDQAFIIFETQNRGLELGQLERSKAVIMRTAHRRADDNITSIQRVWTKIIRAAESADPSTPRRPIRHVLTVAGEWPSYGRHGDEFVENIQELIESLDESIEEYLWGIHGSIKEYETLKNANISRFDGAHNSRLNSAIRQATEKNARSGLPLYWLLQNVNSQGKLVAAVDDLAKLSLRLYLSNVTSSNKRDAILSVYAKFADGAEPREAIRKASREHTPTDRALEIQLQDRKFPRNALTRYTLYRIEAAAFGGSATNGTEYPSAGEDVEIEHIAPEQSFSAKKYSMWRTELDNDEERFNKVRKLIGNLTLLRSSQNQVAGDSPFQQKCPIYTNSDFGMSQAVADSYDTWGFEQIESRTRKLSNLAARVFSFSSSEPNPRLNSSPNNSSLAQFSAEVSNE
jgi:hypothetical protein